MTKGKKKRIVLAVIINLLIFTTACKKEALNSEGESEKKLENSVVIYYVEDMEIASRNEKYQLKQPDILASSVEETITAMTDELETEGFEISSFMLDSEDNLHIVMVKPPDISKEQLLLVKASVCNTLFQLNKLDVIQLVINDEAGNVCSEEMFDENSFYIYKER